MWVFVIAFIIICTPTNHVPEWWCFSIFSSPVFFLDIYIISEWLNRSLFPCHVKLGGGRAALLPRVTCFSVPRCHLIYMVQNSSNNILIPASGKAGWGRAGAQSCPCHGQSNLIGQSLVTWPHATTQHARKCSLYSGHLFTQLKGRDSVAWAEGQPNVRGQLADYLLPLLTAG